MSTAQIRSVVLWPVVPMDVKTMQCKLMSSIPHTPEHPRRGAGSGPARAAALKGKRNILQVAACAASNALARFDCLSMSIVTIISCEVKRLPCQSSRRSWTRERGEGQSSGARAFQTPAGPETSHWTLELHITQTLRLHAPVNNWLDPLKP